MTPTEPADLADMAAAMDRLNMPHEAVLLRRCAADWNATLNTLAETQRENSQLQQQLTARKDGHPSITGATP